jgi:hypothetical protein
MKGVKVRQWLYISIPTSLHKEKKEQQCRMIEVLLEARLPQHLGLRRDSLRLASATFTIVTASLLIRALIITIIILFPYKGIIGVSGCS